MTTTNIISIAGIALTLLITGANAAFFIVIKFNDIFHLGKKVDELKKDMDEKMSELNKEFKDFRQCAEKKLYDNAEKIGSIEGRCRANHG